MTTTKFALGEPAKKRFAGDFKIDRVSSYTPTAAEEAYFQTLERVTKALGNDEELDAEGSNPTGSALVLARQKWRAVAASELRSEAEQVSTDTLDAETAADNALVIKGKYVAELGRLSRSLFVVEEKIEAALASDLLISVARDLPPPNDVPSQDKQALFVALSTANTVIKTVCERIQDRANSWFKRYFTASRGVHERSHSERLLDEYVRKLAGVGRLGLEGPHVQLAKLALDGLRSEFVAQEAGRIKNAYVRSLGVACGVVALLFFGIFAFIAKGWILTDEFWIGHKAFLLAAGGAAVGTWLSFSIRRVTLSFDDLAILEEDLLDPSVRVIFVVALTLTACLLFVTGAMNIEIGNLKTSTFTGATALLVGVFFGIAERTLATAISGRATAFVKGISGGG